MVQKLLVVMAIILIAPLCGCGGEATGFTTNTGTTTTIAGVSNDPGSVDGIGSAARFNQPSGIATDGDNLFVADTGNNTIRKIVISTGAVTTIAGTPGSSGSADGIGSAARFNKPMGIATDGECLFVADTGNNTIRKIVISTGAVFTFAGAPGLSGSADGIGPAARFNQLSAITNEGFFLYVVDTYNGTGVIRQIEVFTGAITGDVKTVADQNKVVGALENTMVGTTLYKTNIDNTINRVKYSNITQEADFTLVELVGKTIYEADPASSTGTYDAYTFNADGTVTANFNIRGSGAGVVFYPISGTWTVSSGLLQVTLVGKTTRTVTKVSTTTDSYGAFTIASSYGDNGILWFYNQINGAAQARACATGGTIPAPSTATLAVITLTPVNSSISPGAPQYFSAMGTYSDNTTQNMQLTAMTWNTSNKSVATIATNGIATAVAVGTTTITASSGAIAATTTLRITAAQ